jgi:hypothetical protein
MKKNVMMRVASVLLVAVMLTTCVISGTFAKYVSSETGTDTAKVAKWGVEIVANGTMFGEHYYATTDDSVAVAYTGSVDSSVADENIVAPGTKGTMAKVALTGTPEVKVAVSYSATLTLTNWMCDDDNDDTTPEVEYCPIYFTINGETYGIVGNTAVALDHGYTSVAALVAGVQDAIAGYSTTYNANTDLSTVGYEALSVSWAWDFYSSDANDIKDTDLGNKAADGLDNDGKIVFEITTTVTQVD